MKKKGINNYMKSKYLVKLLAKEMLEQADNKDIKCLESYLMGFRNGLQKMVYYMTMNVISAAKDEKIKVPKELEEIYEKVKNLQNK